MEKEYIVYILECSDKSFYIGLTSDLASRIADHNTAKYECAYTKNRRPVTLVYSHAFKDVDDAIRWERQVKGWTRIKKEKLIAGLFDDLPELAFNQKQRTILQAKKQTTKNLPLFERPQSDR